MFASSCPARDVPASGRLPVPSFCPWATQLLLPQGMLSKVPPRPCFAFPNTWHLATGQAAPHTKAVLRAPAQSHDPWPCTQAGVAAGRPGVLTRAGVSAACARPLLQGAHEGEDPSVTTGGIFIP